MADFLYDNFKEACLSNSPAFDLDTNTIKVAIYSTSDYTPNASTHTQFTDSSFNNYGSTTDQTLSNKTVTDGVFDDTVVTTFTSVSQDASKTVDGLIVYQDGGTDGTRYLIANIDSFSSVTPNGGNITITWNASGIFTI